MHTISVKYCLSVPLFHFWRKLECTLQRSFSAIAEHLVTLHWRLKFVSSFFRSAFISGKLFYSIHYMSSFIYKIDSRLSKKRNLVCVEDTVNKRGAGKRQNYLYIHSPGGAFSVISLRMAVIFNQSINLVCPECNRHWTGHQGRMQLPPTGACQKFCDLSQITRKKIIELNCLMIIFIHRKYTIGSKQIEKNRKENLTR